MEINIVVRRKLYKQYCCAVIAGRLLRVTGRIQRDNGGMHGLDRVIDVIEDNSPMLDSLLAPADW